MTAALRRYSRSPVTRDVPGTRPLVNLDSVAGGSALPHGELELPISKAASNIAAEPGDVLFGKLRSLPT